MSGGFAELLKLSKTQTAQSELAVQSQIANHRLQLEKKRREQEARERKERELETKLRAKRFEEQRKEEGRRLQREEAERAREQELAKREKEMLDALKYGRRKAPNPRSASSRPKGRNDDIEGGHALTREELREQKDSQEALTREEKRQRKFAADMRRSYASSNPSSSRRKSNGPMTLLPDGRTVRRLPGGAIDYTTISRLADPDAPTLPSTVPEGKSARERLAAVPSTLTKLNTVKRDLRTIDEILIDRAKARKSKTIDGDAAKEFSDWFGKSKKKEPQPEVKTPPSREVSTPPRLPPDSYTAPAKPRPGNSSGTKSKAPLTKPSGSFFRPINPKPSEGNRATPASSTLIPKKRAASPSLSPSPPPPKRRSSGMRDIGSEIWSLFGKDKRSYVARDVLSEDEDMEVDAASLLREEQRSARLAHKEDSIALEEERRHEEEKRRRRKERERRERAA